MATDLSRAEGTGAAGAGAGGAAGGAGGGGGGRHPVRWAAIAVAVLVLLPAVVVLGSRLGEDNVARSPLLGKPAPAFSLPTVDGGTVDNAALAGRPYVVNFWASWCPPCREEHGALEAFYARYGPERAELLGIIYADTTRNAREYREELGGEWPLLEDPDGRASVDFGVRGPPETFVVDHNGIVVAKITGAVRPGQLEAMMAEMGLG